MRDASSGQRLGTRWVDRSMRTKGLVVIAVPIAILFIVLGSTSWFTHVDNRAQDVASNSRQIVDAATTLENSLLSAETETRRLPPDGKPLVPGVVCARREGGPAPARPARGADARLGDRGDLGPSGPARHRPPRGDPGPPERPTTVAGTLHARSGRCCRSVRVETDKLRSDIVTITNRESPVIVSQQSDIHTSNIFLPAIAIAAVVLALAGGVLVSQLFTTGVVRRLRRLERATEDLEHGETPVGVPSGRDEIGRLSARLLDTTAQMRERAEERDRARGELENILTASPVVSLRYDVATQRFSYASPNIDRLFGISGEEAVASPGRIMERLHPDSADHLPRRPGRGSDAHCRTA